MSRFSTSIQKRPLLLLTAVIAGVIALVALIAWIAMPASAGHLDPGPPTTTHNVTATQVDGNNNCGGLGDFEFREQSPSTEVINLEFNGIPFTLTITVYNTAGGQAFDFSFSNGFGVEQVFVKAGPDTNLYDYLGDLGNGVTSDTFLHGPVNPNNNKFYGLSHISFCIVQLETQITIDKTPDSGTLTVGDKIAWDIVISDVADGIDAQNVQVTDALAPAGFDFVITDQGLLPGGTGGSACSIDDTADPNELTCSFNPLADGDSYQVSVETTTAIPLNSSLCGEDIDNTAFATSDNADSVNDSGQQSVECGAIKVNKEVKDPTNGFQPLAGAGFTLFVDNTEATVVAAEQTTGADGVVCFDGLATNTNYWLKETTVPSGYTGAASQTVTTGGGAECPSTGAVTTVTLENTPLTDISIDVSAQVPGATLSTIDCVDSSDTSIGSSGAPDDPASLDVTDLEPDTYTCTIVIDP